MFEIRRAGVVERFMERGNRDRVMVGGKIIFACEWGNVSFLRVQRKKDALPFRFEMMRVWIRVLLVWLAKKGQYYRYYAKDIARSTNKKWARG